MTGAPTCRESEWLRAFEEGCPMAGKSCPKATVTAPAVTTVKPMASATLRVVRIASRL